MIFLRLQSRFRERALEWFCAVHTAGWGVILLLPFDTFSSPSYEILKRFGPEWCWGLGLTLLGLAWLGGLLVNGARPKPTSRIRVVCATAGFIIYLLIGTGFAASHTTPPQGLTFFLIAAASIYSVFRATIDGEKPHGQL